MQTTRLTKCCGSHLASDQLNLRVEPDSFGKTAMSLFLDFIDPTAGNVASLFPAGQYSDTALTCRYHAE
jgi:hypothetical protein